jgi:hypothetical protein
MERAMTLQLGRFAPDFDKTSLNSRARIRQRSRPKPVGAEVAEVARERPESKERDTAASSDALDAPAGAWGY